MMVMGNQAARVVQRAGADDGTGQSHGDTTPIAPRATEIAAKQQVTNAFTLKRANSLRDATAKRSIRTVLWNTMEYPSYSRIAWVWSTIVMTTILVSSFSFVVSSLPEYYQSTDLSFTVLEAVCVSIFTIEYTTRFVTFPSGAKEKESVWLYFKTRFVFARKLMNTVDLLAILPFFIELIVQALSGAGSRSTGALAIVRIVRIARVFRLLKLGKHHEGLEILILTMKASWSFLISVLFLVIILMVLFGSLIFFTESGSLCLIAWTCVNGPDDGKDCTNLIFIDETGNNYTQPWSSEKFLGKMASGQPSRALNQSAPIDSQPDPGDCRGVGNICFMADGSLTLFNSIPITMWWALVTMCCVGFGDLRPTTWGGQLIGAVTALTGVIVLAMPTTVIGTNFSDIYEMYHEQKEENDLRMRELAKRRGFAANQIAPEPTDNVSAEGVMHGFDSKSTSVDEPKSSGNDYVEDLFAKSKRRDKQVIEMIEKYTEDLPKDEEWDMMAARARLKGLSDISSHLAAMQSMQ